MEVAGSRLSLTIRTHRPQVYEYPRHISVGVEPKRQKRLTKSHSEVLESLYRKDVRLNAPLLAYSGSYGGDRGVLGRWMAR
jgi:hypothetical protein